MKRSFALPSSMKHLFLPHKFMRRFTSGQLFSDPAKTAAQIFAFAFKRFVFVDTGIRQSLISKASLPENTYTYETDLSLSG